jgi:hypothetical protein
MTISAARPNFFLLLELNPDEKWDLAVYKKALQEKNRQWNRDSDGVAKKALLAQVNRALLPQIREVMETATLRQKEAEEARELLSRRYRIENEYFEKQLILLNLKEQAEPDEIARFIKDFKHIASAESIQKRITVKILQANEQNDHEPASLDASMISNIADRLEILHMETLYDLVQCIPQCKTATVFHAAEKIYTDEVRQHSTAESTVRVELAGFAMNLFKTDEMRARYDEALRQTSLQQLLKDLEDSAKRCKIKEIHPRQVLYYLKQAAKNGWKEQEALKHLKEHGRTRQWFVTIPESVLTEEEKHYRVDNESTQIEHMRTVDSTAPIENVQELQYHILNSAIRLYWKWPPDCQAVYISYGAGTGAIQHNTADVTTCYVSQAEYDRLGYYDISGNWDQHYSILISSIIDQGGGHIVGNGTHIHLHLHKTVLTYEIQLAQIRHRKRVLYMVVNTSGPIPPLVLISKAHGLPLKKTDGDRFYTIEGQTNKKGEMRIDLPNTILPIQTFGKLFLEDERLYNTIIINHPARKQLRLS